MSALRPGMPRIIILVFLLLMIIVAARAGIPASGLVNDSLVRLFMNGVLVLSLLPMLRVGAGINYGLPVGILAGLLGMAVTVNLGVASLPGFLLSLLLAGFFGVALGLPYARVLNLVKGREEIAGLFIGFASVYAMCFFWAVAPFQNPEMLWPIGGHGLRPTIGLTTTFGRSLNHLGQLHLGDLVLPLGGLAFFLLLCGLLHFFFYSKTGLAITAVGENPSFARINGLQVDRVRSQAIVLSTVIAALGICVYAQSYGFLELYEAPLMMAFPAASAILLGGSGGYRSGVGAAIIGTFLFQSVYVVSGPVANCLLVPELSEIVRVILTSGVILYALVFMEERGAGDEED
jgi:simple sugar transport system permease protein